MKIMGHRGCRGEAPENTLLGIESAILKGVQAIEIDVHKTSDNEIVVIHDDTVDRTTNGKGKIREQTFVDLRKLDAGKKEKIPLLSEVLTLLKNHPNIELQIELKAYDCEKRVIQIIKDFDMISRITIISFIHPFLVNIKNIEPSIKTACLLYGLPVNPVAITKDARADGLSVSLSTIDKELVEKCHKASLCVTTWNANTVEDLRVVVSMGVDYVGTDVPGLIVPAFAKFLS